MEPGKAAAVRGVSVILDYGFWAKSQREEKYREAVALGAGFAIRYVHAPVEELWRRLEARNREDRDDVFQTITREDLEESAALFQEPDQAELRGRVTVDINICSKIFLKPIAFPRGFFYNKGQK